MKQKTSQINALIDDSWRLVRLRIEEERLEGPCEYFELKLKDFDSRTGIRSLSLEKIDEKDLKSLAGALGDKFNEMVDRVLSVIGLPPFIAKCGDHVGAVYKEGSNLVVLKLVLWVLR